MEPKKKYPVPDFPSLALAAICAVVWVASCVLDEINSRPLSVGKLVLTIVLCIGFFVLLYRYRKNRKEQ